jgi:putative membrane protein
MLASELGVPLLVYIAGACRLWRAAGWGRGIRLWEASAFLAGWLALALALSPLMDRWSDVSLVGHMLQHELLMVVAAPLMAVGAPLVAFCWALPNGTRQQALQVLHKRGVVGLRDVVTSPAVAFFLHALALWVWHIPALYDYALEHEGVHALEHICFFGTATMFWWGITHGQYGRVGYGAAVVYLFATALHSGVLGALLAFSARVWYPAYGIPLQPYLTPLEDQQLAGLLMWIPAGLIFAAGALVLFARWLRESDRHTRFVRPLARQETIQ